VLDSRPARDGEAVRRRRECEACARRFTTFESLEAPVLLVVKRDGGREPFDREKVLAGMLAACHKRPVSLAELRAAAERVERDLADNSEGEIGATDVGDRVMEELAKLDPVAFVRFASVYQAFEGPEQFEAIVRNLAQRRRARPGKHEYSSRQK
jgi:transcriptional repressor NrdR